ncbi:MAG: CoA transferase [Dehalococcoidia bacterium]|jgi:crotonobetainyl-CoA:carnitine CoA-transferase CaiB-like acyl-CoA transferase
MKEEKEKQKTAGPLAGVKVVEITMFQQGPVCGTKLGDMGADVIKVEPKVGDPGRGFMRIIGTMVGLKGRNYYFEQHNRNKRSIVLDMKNEDSLEIFLKLIDEADVFLTNMSIEAPQKMGIGPDVLMKRNPRLIYAQASGWGRKGPDAHELSFDYTGIGRSGLMMSCGERGTPPAQVLPGLGDELGGMVCAWAICAALYAREKTGVGQVVDTSLMGSLICMESLILSAPAVLGQEFPREKRSKAGNPIYNHYQAKDGKWFILAHLQPDRYWPGVCRAMGMPELEKDPRFESIEARGENAKELVAIMDKQFATKTRDQWFEIFEREKLIHTPIQTPSEVVNDAQAIANDYVTSFDHPVLGKTKMVGFPWDFSGTPASVRREAPELGQHTEEILLELGYDWEAITRLKDNGAIP